MKKLLAWLLTFALLLTSAAAVLAEAAEEQSIVSEGPQVAYDYDELTVAVSTPLTGNFFTSMWGNLSSDLDVRNLIHAYNLVEWDVETGTFIPDSSVISGITPQPEADGDVTFIIMLYEDMVYNDGTPVTARDYAFSFLLTMSPEMKELGAAVRTPEYIDGYSDYISGNAKALRGVRLISDHQLNITIDSGYLPFFYELGLLDCVPYPISVIAPGVQVADDGHGVYLKNAEGTDDTPVFTADLLKETVLNEQTGYRTHPSVTSGPYRLVSYEDGTAEFEINPQYKGNSSGKKPTIPKIKVVYLALDELAPALEDGSITLMNRVSDEQVITACLGLTGQYPLLTSANYPRSGVSFICFNTDRTPLDDLAVRQAIAYIADRDGMVSETLGNYGMRAIGYFGMGQWMYLLLNGTVAYPVEEPEDETDAKAQAEYEAAINAWKELSLDTIEPYDRNAEKGAELLDSAGWNLNEKGEAFDPEQDHLRYKQTEEGLKPLQLTLAYAEGSAAGKALEGVLVQSLAEAGIELKAEAIPTEELTSQYYRLTDVQYDMFFLATNFDVLYDPSLSFTATEDGHHVWKTSGLVDDELWELAVSMRRTEPGDLLGYCGKWLEFQKRVAEHLPVLPVYSNVYFDFYPQVLHEYTINANISWPQAIIGAYLADYVPEAETQPAED